MEPSNDNNLLINLLINVHKLNELIEREKQQKNPETNRMPRAPKRTGL